MYHVLVQFDVRPEARDAFRALALRHAAESLGDEPGTLLFHVAQDEVNPDRFYTVEAYADRAAYEAHRQGPALRRNGPLLDPLLAAPPFPLGRGPSIDSPDTSSTQ